MPDKQAAKGDLERAVLEQLWARPDGATVRDVLDGLGERELAYTTVMTVLDRLAKKNLVLREREGRAWLYRPGSSREELTAEALRDTLQPLDRQDRRAALMHFVSGASGDEIDDLKEALRALEQDL